MDQYRALVISNFIEENWAAFEQRAKEAGEDPEVVLNEIKDESRQA